MQPFNLSLNYNIEIFNRQIRYRLCYKWQRLTIILMIIQYLPNQRRQFLHQRHNPRFYTLFSNQIRNNQKNLSRNLHLIHFSLQNNQNHIHKIPIINLKHIDRPIFYLKLTVWTNNPYNFQKSFQQRVIFSEWLKKRTKKISPTFSRNMIQTTIISTSVLYKSKNIF